MANVFIVDDDAEIRDLCGCTWSATVTGASRGRSAERADRRSRQPA